MSQQLLIIGGLETGCGTAKKSSGRQDLGFQILDENRGDLLPDERRVYKSVVFTRA